MIRLLLAVAIFVAGFPALTVLAQSDGPMVLTPPADEPILKLKKPKPKPKAVAPDVPEVTIPHFPFINSIPRSKSTAPGNEIA